MKKSPLLLYAAYTAAVIVVGLYARFPSEAVGDYAAREAERRIPGLTMSVGDVRPAFPVAVRFAGIEAAYQSIPLIELDAARVAPVWSSILSSSRAAVLTSTVGGGRLRATFRIPKEELLTPLLFDAEFEGIQLAQLDALSNLLGRRISGLCAGSVSNQTDPDPAPGPIRIQLRLTDAAVDLRQPILRRDRLNFQRIDTEMAVTGNDLDIRECTLRGDAFDAEVAGRITLQPNIEDSRIDLRGTVKPQTTLMAELKKMVPAGLLAAAGTEGIIPFQLTGTVKNPRYLLQ